MEIRLHTRTGFTLIELSIVLVIIGLLVGGVLVGRDLIRAAEIRSTIGDLEKLKTAINTFRVKYNCLPGDCPNATSFFGVDSNGCTGQSNFITDTGTCNGNGDEIYLPSTNAEWVLATQHLELAGFWPLDATAAIQGRQFKIRGVSDATIGYIFTNDLWDPNDGQTPVNGRFGNTITLAAASGSCLSGTPFSVLDAQNMDAKLDDGHASSGKLFGMNGLQVLAPQPGCGAVSTCLAAGGDYDLTNPTATCRMILYW